MRHWFFVVCLAYLCYTPLVAQSDSFAVFVWRNRLYTHNLRVHTQQDLGLYFDGIEKLVPDSVPDVYSLELSPIKSLPKGYGFHHGVWSPDKRQFAYVLLESIGLGHRLMLYQEGETRSFIPSDTSIITGFLDPIGWTDHDTIIAVECHQPHELKIVQLWEIDPDTGEQHAYLNHAASPLFGRTSTDGERILLGFNPKLETGYLLDIKDRTVSNFHAPFEMPEPPRSVFELSHLPIAMLGIIKQAEVNNFAAQIALTQPEQITLPRPEPFLHWPLPDSQRAITCYPHSNWTAANFDFTCPGQGDYPRHQGTDVGGRPSGLPIKTQVYAAAPGYVVAINDRCNNTNPSCGSAYGNYVLIEHIIEVNGTIQTWLTGYAHLQQPLVNPGDYIHDLTEPIGLSGQTGVGGAHLHFEVRNIMPNGGNRWVDPWGDYYPPYGDSLWLDGNELPRAVSAS